MKSLFLRLLASSFLAVILTAVGGNGASAQVVTTPEAAFEQKVFPFFQSPRCFNCHDFDSRRQPGGPLSYHPALQVTNQNPVNCIGCHTSGVVGFDNWVEAPDDPQWSGRSANELREDIIFNKGNKLYNHLIGTGANKDPFVQWAFSNPPDAPPIKPGGVPAGGPHMGNLGNFPGELMDWTAFEAAVKEWMCLEAKERGTRDLGQPADLDCSAFAHCGDGILDPGEACDDGNTSNTDACLNTCVRASCGDGFVQAFVEACDDGNTSNTDACLNTCVRASCGDGFVQAGVEDCDDGNTVDGDGCPATCRPGQTTGGQTTGGSGGGCSLVR